MTVESYIYIDLESLREIKNERTSVGARVCGISRGNMWPCGCIRLPCKSTLVKNRTDDKNVF
jgi:hypothetical protein